jgi:hypothetical protein
MAANPLKIIISDGKQEDDELGLGLEEEE